MKQSFNAKYVKFNTLGRKVTNIRDNPFVDDATQDAYNAAYVLFQYCLHSLSCEPKKCPVAQVIGCGGKNAICCSPTVWGYELFPKTRENDGGLHREEGV